MVEPVQYHGVVIRRRLAIAIPPVLVSGALLAWLLAVQSRLPDQVAIHWGADGRPNGFTSPTAMPWVLTAITLAAAGPLTILATLSRPGFIAPRFTQGLPLAVTAFLAAIAVGVVAPQLDLNVDPAPVSLPWTTFPVGLVTAVAGGFTGAALAGRPGRPPVSTEPAGPEAPRHPIPDGAVTVWSGRTPLGSAMVVGAAAVTLVLFVLAAATSWWLLIVPVVMTALIVGTTSFTTTIGPAGLRAVGLFGLPRITIPLNTLQSVETGRIEAWKFGGWGLRKGPGGTDAIVTRSGPALFVTRTDGARLGITLDHPEQPAAILASLLDRRAENAGRQP